METPEIRLNEVQTFEAGETFSAEIGESQSFEAGEVSSKVVTSTEVIPNDLSELVRKLNNATEIIGSSVQNALPGDQALLVGLTVQIQAVAKLFVDAAQQVADTETDTLPLAEED